MSLYIRGINILNLDPLSLKPHLNQTAQKRPTKSVGAIFTNLFQISFYSVHIPVKFLLDSTTHLLHTRGNLRGQVIDQPPWRKPSSHGENVQTQRKHSPEPVLVVL